MKRISHGFLICKHRLIQGRLTANFIPVPLTVFYHKICVCQQQPLIASLANLKC